MQDLSSSRRALFALAAVVGLVAGCGGSKWSTEPRTAVASATSTTLIGGPLGTTLEVPAGALTGDTEITIALCPRGRRPGEAVVVSSAVRMSPSGVTFVRPVEIVLPVDLEKLPAGSTLDDVVVLRAEQTSSVFVPLPTRRASPASVAALTEHFSDFVAVVLTPGLAVSVRRFDVRRRRGLHRMPTRLRPLRRSGSLRQRALRGG